MKSWRIPLVVPSLFGFCLLLGLDAPAAHADFIFGEPAVSPPTGAGDDSHGCFSSDGLEMYFTSNRAGTQGGFDLWVVRRASEDDPWGIPDNLGPAVNSASYEVLGSISADGLALYFCSDRPYGDDIRYDIYVTTRAGKDDPWGQAVKLGPPVSDPASTEYGVWISPDNLELYINSLNRSGGLGRFDIYVAKRANVNDPWSEAVNLGPVVNSPYMESFCSLSPDGLLLLFSEHWTGGTGSRPSGDGVSGVWMARRVSLSDPWQAPVSLGPRINSTAIEVIPRISPDGRTLYVGSPRSGSFKTWQASITPIVDFNADGKVDLVDLVMLIDNWGTSNPLYDIGPFAWGDGKVDIEDLKVFMTYYEKENPPAQP